MWTCALQFVAYVTHKDIRNLALDLYHPRRKWNYLKYPGDCCSSHQQTSHDAHRQKNAAFFSIDLCISFWFLISYVTFMGCAGSFESDGLPQLRIYDGIVICLTNRTCEKVFSVTSSLRLCVDTCSAAEITWESFVGTNITQTCAVWPRNMRFYTERLYHTH